MLSTPDLLLNHRYFGVDHSMADADVSSATFEFAVETAENVETDARETTQSAETDGGDGDDTGGSGPGFTPVLTVLALVGAALLARRS